MTRAVIETRILGLYTGGNEAEAFNIRTIAKQTNASYPHVYNAIQSMVERNLLTKRAIGKSTYCTPNLKDALARNLLTQANILRKAELFTTPNLQNLEKTVIQLAQQEPRILAALYHKGNLHFIITDAAAQQDILKRISFPEVSFSTAKNLSTELLSSLEILRDGVTLVGYERLLLLLQPIHEQLLLNHSRLFREVHR